MAFCILQELDSVVGTRMQPLPQATTPPGRKWEALRIVAMQANKVRVIGRLQSRRIQEEIDPLCLPCPILVSSSLPYHRGKALSVV